jgi:hypothetical protein
VLSLVNLYLLAVVMHKYRESQLGGGVWRKLKTWILVLSMALFIIDFIRNFVGDVMPWKVTAVLLYLNQVLQFTVYVLIC